MGCCVFECSNHHRQDKAVGGIKLSYHRFPNKDRSPVRHNAWVKKISRKNFVPTSRTMVCSEHFTVDDFDSVSLMKERLGLFDMRCKRILRKTAVPSRKLRGKLKAAIEDASGLHTGCLIKPVAQGSSGGGNNLRNVDVEKKVVKTYAVDISGLPKEEKKKIEMFVLNASLKGEQRGEENPVFGEVQKQLKGFGCKDVEKSVGMRSNLDLGADNEMTVSKDLKGKKECSVPKLRRKGKRKRKFVPFKRKELLESSEEAESEDCFDTNVNNIDTADATIKQAKRQTTIDVHSKKVSLLISGNDNRNSRAIGIDSNEIEPDVNFEYVETEEMSKHVGTQCILIGGNLKAFT